MNPTNLPTLAENDAIAGMVFTKTEANVDRSIDHKALGIACIELIGKLENEFAKAKQMDQEDYIDESAATARNLLDSLAKFSSECLSGNAAEQAMDEISKALTISHTYDQVLKTRPLGNALLRTFWKAEETEPIKQAHAALGEVLVRATAATLYHAIMMLGFDSPLGIEIDQSTVVFVTELDQSW